MQPFNSWIRFSLMFAVTITVTSLSSPINADDEPSDDSNREVDRLIHALSARDFVARREAEQELVSRGADVVDALAAAAGDGPRETTLRCLEILSRLMIGDDEAAGEAAKQALQGLVDSEDASLAERARSLVEEIPEPDEIQPNRGRGVFLAPIQLRVRQARGFDANGRRSMDVQQDGKSIHIEETRGEGILVRITETVDGEEQTREVSAENVAELRGKDAEAYGLYRDHMLRGGGGAVVLNAQLQAQPRGNRQVSVTEVNGERVVRVKEDGREIEIRSTDDKDIRIEVTEVIDGEEKITEYEADDVDDLRERHPKGAELYEEFRGQGAQIQVQALFNVVGGGLQIGRRAVPGPGPAAGNSEAQELIDESLGELEDIREQLQQRGEDADAQSLADLVQRLEEAEQRLHDAREKLE